MTQPVRCGVIGLGLMGSVHADILSGMGRAELAVCCDIDPAAAERSPEGTRFTDDYRDLLSEPGLQAVIVATPEHLHREPVEAALEAGLSVFCEKPIASTLEDADAMIAVEQATNGRLVIGHVLRFDPRYSHVHDSVTSGALGQAIHTATRRSSSYAEGRHLVNRTRCRCIYRYTISTCSSGSWGRESPVSRPMRPRCVWQTSVRMTLWWPRSDWTTGRYRFMRRRGSCRIRPV